jgi:hypothetical protein
MVEVPAGSFVMGDGEAYCGEDEHMVTLTRSFYLGQTEVTNQEYMEALQWAYDHDYVTADMFNVNDNMDGSWNELLYLAGDGCEMSFADEHFAVDTGKQDHPVKEVTWYGAARYCDWLSMQEGLARAYAHSGIGRAGALVGPLLWAAILPHPRFWVSTIWSATCMSGVTTGTRAVWEQHQERIQRCCWLEPTA